MNLLEISLRYLRAIEEGQSTTDFYDPEVIQEEFPNRLTVNGARRTLSDLRAAAERGKKAVSSQTFEVLGSIVEGERACLEIQWTGILAVPFGTLPVGGAMRARIAMILEFRNGKIIAQRNYDCFEPF